MDSYNTLNHKIATGVTLFHRASTLCSKENLTQELKKVETSLEINGYNKNIIKTCRKTSENITNRNLANNRNESTEKARYISVPYIREASERVSRLLKPYNIKLGNKPTNTIKSKLCHPKDKILDQDKNEIIYEIKCKDCDAQYIGETGKELNKRVTEHKNAVRRKDRLSKIYNHCSSTQHEFDFDNSRVLNRHKYDKNRRVLESFYSHVNQNSINRYTDIHTTYIPLVNEILQEK